MSAETYAERRDRIVRPDMQGVQEGCTCEQCSEQ
jgi:hypothetical protein